MDGFAVVQNPAVAEPPWSEQMRRVAYDAEDLISCDQLYILIDNYVYLITTSCQHNLRDVGVAGSNPVTPTIDFNRVFTQRDNKNHHLVPDKIFFGPVLVPLSTLVECVSSRLSQCDALRPR